MLYQVRCLVGTTSNLLLVPVGWKKFRLPRTRFSLGSFAFG